MVIDGNHKDYGTVSFHLNSYLRYKCESVIFQLSKKTKKPQTFHEWGQLHVISLCGGSRMKYYSPIHQRDNLLEETFWIISDKNLTITFVYFTALAQSLLKRSIILKWFFLPSFMKMQGTAVYHFCS